MRKPPVDRHSTPVAAVLGIVLGSAVFLGVPIWLGIVGHAPAWIAAWTFVSAPASPAGIDMIDGWAHPTAEARINGHEIARVAAIFARIGAIGLACFALGRILA